jgi:hypothetical protein
MRWTLAGLVPAIGVMGLGLAPPVAAGIPSRCDLARIAARDAILSKYEQRMSELRRGLSEARASGKAPARSGAAASLAAELDAQQAKDLGRADRQVSKGCANDSNAVENAKQTAESMAALGIAAVLSQHGISDTGLAPTPPPLSVSPGKS